MAWRKNAQRLCLRGRLTLTLMLTTYLASTISSSLCLILFLRGGSLLALLALASLTALLLTGVSTWVGLRLAREIAAPVAAMQDVVDKMLQGQPTPTNARLGGTPEIRWLGVAINRLRRIYMRSVPEPTPDANP